jgi:hypothetical protein
MNALELAKQLIELVEIHGNCKVVYSFSDERPDCFDYKIQSKITEIEIKEKKENKEIIFTLT